MIVLWSVWLVSHGWIMAASFGPHAAGLFSMKNKLHFTSKIVTLRKQAAMRHALVYDMSIPADLD
ncbi:hypothetical protein BJX68DRAFT_222523, partial [Aspergillus pseudodeflectus]